MNCHACGTPLAAAARFCHKCGAQTSGGQAAGWRGGLPWAGVGAALGALVTVLLLRFGWSREPGAVSDGAPGGGGRDPSFQLPAADLSQDSTVERATHLYHRGMYLTSRG